MKASGQRETRRACDKAPEIPTVDTSTASAFKGKLQVGLLFLGNAIALRAMDVYSEYPLLVPARPENFQEE